MIEPDHESFREPQPTMSRRELALEIVASFWPIIVSTLLLIPLAWWLE
ncbi:hypothetical protein [Mesorhizobium sp. B2-3-4]|nr:hypothetical protein [Mesorhizobium sp. B2-3-4]